MKFLSKLLSVITMCSHIALVHACVCVSLCVLCLFYVICYSPFIVSSSLFKREDEISKKLGKGEIDF